MSARVILLGPQRLEPTLQSAVDDLDVRGSVATITAGWEEREAEDEELDKHLGGGTRNLALFPRAEQVFQRDASLLGAARQRHDRQRDAAEIYRTRLASALDAARELLRRIEVGEGPLELLEREAEHAIESVRDLDRRHREWMTHLDRAFEEEARIAEHAEVQRHRGEIEQLLGDCGCVCVAGGHVRILFERMRLFGVGKLIRELPIVAWSAGAMALSSTIVLFHDSPPQGAGNAEVFGPGIGLIPGVVPLPHAKRRLALDDRLRVALFARRFGPDLCPALDEGTRLDWDGESWTARAGTLRLEATGTLVEATA
ncbi:MAG: type 1 glutamine amidotransferase-like domain-containing protein [bacterium]|nr:type 1 glutamine amidotransferase-like domain-containing protein [bacterium]